MAARVGVIGIVNNANNLKCPAGLNIGESEVGADGILTAFEELAYKRLVHHCNATSRGCVLLRDAAAAHDVLSHGFEIAGINPIPRRHKTVVGHIWLPLPLANDDLAPVIGKRRIDRKSTRLNSSHLGISYAV